MNHLKRLISTIAPIMFLLNISGCGELLSGNNDSVDSQSSEPGISDFVVEDLIGTLSFTYTETDAAESTTRTITFTEANSFVDLDGVRKLELREENIIVTCQYLPISARYLCTSVESLPVGNSPVVRYEYTGGRSGRGWLPIGTITLDNGLFQTSIDNLNSVLNEWAFSWSDGRETFSIDQISGTILKGNIVISASGVLTEVTLCAATTFDLTSNCPRGQDTAPYIQINSDGGWLASRSVSQIAEADSNRGRWSGPFYTESDVSVTAFLFTIDSQNSGSGVFESCSARLSADTEDIATFTQNCVLGLTETPDGDVDVVLVNDTSLLP